MILLLRNNLLTFLLAGALFLFASSVTLDGITTFAGNSAVYGGRKVYLAHQKLDMIDAISVAPSNTPVRIYMTFVAPAVDGSPTLMSSSTLFEDIVG